MATWGAVSGNANVASVNANVAEKEVVGVDQCQPQPLQCGIWPPVSRVQCKLVFEQSIVQMYISHKDFAAKLINSTGPSYYGCCFKFQWNTDWKGFYLTINHFTRQCSVSLTLWECLWHRSKEITFWGGWQLADWLMRSIQMSQTGKMELIWLNPTNTQCSPFQAKIFGVLWL